MLIWLEQTASEIKNDSRKAISSLGKALLSVKNKQSWNILLSDSGIGTPKTQEWTGSLNLKKSGAGIAKQDVKGKGSEFDSEGLYSFKRDGDKRQDNLKCSINQFICSNTRLDRFQIIKSMTTVGAQYNCLLSIHSSNRSWRYFIGWFCTFWKSLERLGVLRGKRTLFIRMKTRSFSGRRKSQLCWRPSSRARWGAYPTPGYRDWYSKFGIAL